MRETLFRAKRADNREWVEGCGIIATENWVSIFAVIDDLETNSADVEEYEVIPETVGQFTGLTDKNGNRIWEGDILRIAKIADGIGGYYNPPLDYPVNVVVKWDLCAWMWETLCEDKRYISFPDAWCHYEFEVIGNITDNPEQKGSNF